MPLPDDELARHMRAEAEALAQRYELDFSPASLDAVDAVVMAGSAIDTDEVAAYLGEVLVRAGLGFQWARAPAPDRETGVAVDQWLASPDEWVRLRQERPKKSDHLRKTVEDVLSFATAPTHETAAGLGWRRRSRLHWWPRRGAR
jgi:hypothetical protein